MLISGKSLPKGTSCKSKEEIKVVGSSSLTIISNPPKRRNLRRKKVPMFSDDSDSEKTDSENSVETNSECTGIQSSVENVTEKMDLDSLPKRSRSINQTKSTSTTRTTAKLMSSSKPGATQEILEKLKGIEVRQETIEDNLAAIIKMLERKMDMVHNQINLVGLISLATMQEMQLPSHRMGIIRSLTDDYSEEITNEYCDVLIKGLNDAIKMVKDNSKNQFIKQNPTDEFIQNSIKPSNN
jgi:hypothetical protein